MSIARPNQPLVLTLLTYVKPIEEIDALRPRHLEWISARIAAGEVLLAGRRDSASGGVLLYRGSADAVEAIARTDPYITEGAATLEVVGFTAAVASAEVGALLA
ncbi:YciI family protein [Sphingomonas sp. 3-13AW]|uniref:YciI family protein n=1 Tax=Sphingomonas sp. 3-13AW TaxID=3050450 RepID=UPI003BB7BF6D